MRRFPPGIHNLKNQFTKVELEGAQWDITSISTLLNELKGWKTADKFRTRDMDGVQCLVFHFEHSGISSEIKIYVYFRLCLKIEVFLLSKTIEAHWTSEYSRMISDRDERQRKLKQPRLFPAVCYKDSITPTSNAAHPFLLKKIAIFCDVTCYSEGFIYFCKNLLQNKFSWRTPRDISSFTCRAIYTKTKYILYITKQSVPLYQVYIYQ